MRIHTTKDGTKIKLCDMTDSHLAATIRMMERKASEGITVCMGGGSCPDEFWYDEYTLEGKAALEHMGYDDYVKERDRRRTGSAPVPDWVAEEIKTTWRAARDAGGEMAAFRIIERMVDRLGYGRTENNPSLVPNATGERPETRSERTA